MTRRSTLTAAAARTVALLGLATFVAIGVAPAASAQESDPGTGDRSEEGERPESNGEAAGDVEVKRGRTIRLEAHGARLERPAGWVRARPGDGAAVTLRAAGDEESQIEVRVSAPVPAERKEGFFSAFHAELERAGFEQKNVRAEATYNDHTGRWTVYTGSTRRGTYRMIVWQYYHDRAAWLFVGFFPEPRAERYVDDFESLLSSLTFR